MAIAATPVAFKSGTDIASEVSFVSYLDLTQGNVQTVTQYVRDIVSVNQTNIQTQGQELLNKVVKVTGSSLASDTEKAVWNDKYTKNEADNKLTDFGTNLLWKGAVGTFADLATAYPTPLDNWTVPVNDELVDYRYDTATGVWVDLGNTNVPLATATVDGKITSTDFVKLRDIEPLATADQTNIEVRDLLRNLPEADKLNTGDITGLTGIKRAADGAGYSTTTLDFSSGDIIPNSGAIGTSFTITGITNPSLGSKILEFSNFDDVTLGVATIIRTTGKYIKASGKNFLSLACTNTSPIEYIASWMNESAPVYDNEQVELVGTDISFTGKKFRTANFTTSPVLTFSNPVLGEVITLRYTGAEPQIPGVKLGQHVAGKTNLLVMSCETAGATPYYMSVTAS